MPEQTPRRFEIEPMLNAKDGEEYPDECGECDGEGYVEGDCFEDTCCCADPITSHGLVKCSTCGGTGWIG